MRLFVERAQAAMPGFVLTEQNVPVVLQVCRRLDGIPLAIELAAARLRALSIEQIAARLDSRFRLLTGGSREALPRQQTLQATIDWSYDLISGPERTLLRRLSVFAGGWRLEAAEAVCGDDDRPPTTDHRRPADASPGMDTPQAVVGRRSSVVAREEVLDLLTALVDKSLVLYGEEPETPPPSGARYRLLETIRQYASDRLLVSGEAEAVRDRHRDHFLQLAQQAALKLGGPEQVVWLDRLEAEHDNLRVALSGCREAEMATRMAVSLSEFWEARGYKIEGWEALRQILEQGGEIPPDLRARATRAAGLLAIRVGEYGPARVLLEESLARQRTLGDPAGIAAALHHLGILEVYAGHLRRARAYGEESLAIRRQAGDRHGSAFVLNHLGVVRIKLGDYAGARACLEESVVLMRAAGNKRGLAKVLANLGWLAQDQSDDTAARPLVEESLTLYREAGDEAGVANALRHLAGIAHRQGDAPGAAALGEESVALWRKVGERVALASTLNALGTMAREQRNAAAARSHFEEALALSRELGSQQAIVASLQNLGDLAWDAEDYGLATALFKERLRLDPKQRDPRGIAASLAGLAAVAVAEGEALRAARLLGAAEALLDTTVSPLLPAARSQYDRTATAARDVAGEAAFSTSWAEGRAMTPNQAIGYALRGVCAGLEPSTKFEREG